MAVDERATISLAPALWLGTWLGSETSLWAYRDSYTAIIYMVQHNPPVAKGYSALQHEGGITYIADYENPRRVAFEPSGILDNWSSIV